jgi:hypothetical protein
MRLRALLESDPNYFEVIRGALPGPTEAEGQLGDLPGGKKCDGNVLIEISAAQRSGMGSKSTGLQ